MSANPPSPMIIPTMRYRDARAAIAWLCEAFGFELHMVTPEEGPEVHHAQLVHGRGMVMLGSARDDEFGRYIQAPQEGAAGTQSAYVIIPDVPAHYERAKARGACIAMELREEPYGGHAYSCLDPEGHLWNFAEYDPFAEPE